MPFLSIIVPVYNVEKYLTVCIEAVLNQKFTDYELLLIDDGSTDSSGTICDKYADGKKIRVIHQRNGGLLMARRIGFKESRGMYVLCADADDYHLPDALSHIYEDIQKTGCDMLVFDYIYGAGQNKPERVIHVCPEKNMSYFEGKCITRFREQLLEGKDFNSLCCKVVKRSCVDIEADYSTYAFVANGEDSFQSIPILDKVSSITYLPIPLYYYRRDNISMSKHYGRKDFSSFMCVYERAYKYAKKWGINDEVIKNVKKRFLNLIVSVVLQARKECNRQEYCKFLETVISDDSFKLLTSNLSTDNKYSKTVLFFLKKKMPRIAVFFIDAVNAVKYR